MSLTAIRTWSVGATPIHYIYIGSPRVRLSCTVSTPVIDTKCKYQLLAKDGVYMPSTPRTIVKGLLASGNRADVLINCPVGDFTFSSTGQKGDFAMRLAASSSPYDIIDGVLLHIHSVDRGAPPQCDLPVFEVNRPCCDWPPFKPRTHNDLLSPNPVFASCSGRPRQPARAGGGKEPDV